MRAVLVIGFSAGCTQLGSMPATTGIGRQQKGDPYLTGGLSVTLGLGASR